MKISYNWLKNYIRVDLPPREAGDLLTACGLEVESIEKYESVKGGLKGIVVGEVLTCVKHPDSDHLTLTTVNVGQGDPLRIVCGAPNVMTGQKVPVATVGTTLYNNDKEIQIRETKIRGQLSQGMICAEDELGLGTSHDGIMVLDPDAIPGTPGKDYFHIEEDVVFEIGLTPNRTDATSHIGVARDLAAVLNNHPKYMGEKQYPLLKPDVSGFKPDNSSGKTEIIIEDPKSCPRYSGLTISNVTVKESPEWLKNRLNAIKVRPINNVVDITNFILHETGHPLHAFDADQIRGNKVIIKKLPKGTHFVTLDEIDRELSDQDLMICNEKEPMCIAGVFGGIRSGVTEKTRNLFLESAYFDPKSVRKTSKLHGLQTDASFRFERGADFNITTYALKRAAMLISEIAGGEITSDVMDVYPAPIPDPVVELPWSVLDRLSGAVLDRAVVKNILLSLGIAIQDETRDGLKLGIPSFKADVLRDVDVIEEILRIYGYDNIKTSPAVHSSISYMEKPDREKVQNAISDYLSANGFNEIMNNSLTKSFYYEKSGKFRKENLVRILNPISSDLDVMRQTLLYGGLESVVFNQNRKITDVRLYEFGNVYFSSEDVNAADPLEKIHEEKHLSLFISGQFSKEAWNTRQRSADFFDMKGFITGMIARAGLNVGSLSERIVADEVYEKGLEFSIGKQVLVTFGILKSSLLRAFDCRQPVFSADFNWDVFIAVLPGKEPEYREVPKFPEVRRDLALLIDKPVTFTVIRNLAFETEKKILKKVSLFDVYEGEKIGQEKKSYAMSFILQDENKTLKDEEIDRVMNKLIKTFREKLLAQIR